MKHFLLTLILLGCSFSSVATLLSQEEIDHFNVNSEHLKIVNTFDPTKITTLVVGAGILGSERHFFGSTNIHMGILGKGHVTKEGKFFDKDRLECINHHQIPELKFDSLNNIVLYNFLDIHGDVIVFKNKKEALQYQNRNIISPMEVDPEYTLFLDINDVIMDPYIGQINDYIHLKGSVFDLARLPFGIKVNKIVVEYLGDDLYEGKNFEVFDWTWMRNFQYVINPNGKVFFEMRIGMQTSQDPKIEKVILSKDLDTLALNLSCQFKPWEDVLFDCYYRINKNTMPALLNLTDEDLQALKSNLFPIVVDPAIKIAEILKEKFKSNGFLCLSIKDCPRQSINHIPNRFYRCLRFEMVQESFFN